MAIEMPKFSASRPAWSMNGSWWRRVSHTASGPMTEPNGTTSPAKVDRVGGHRAVADLLAHRSGQGRLVGAARGQVGAALRAGLRLVIQPGRAGRAGLVHDLSFICAPWDACWYVIDNRLPGALRRRPRGDTWRSAGGWCGGAPSSPRRSPAPSAPSTRLVVAGGCGLSSHDQLVGRHPPGRQGRVVVTWIRWS